MAKENANKQRVSPGFDIEHIPLLNRLVFEQPQHEPLFL